MEALFLNEPLIQKVAYFKQDYFNSAYQPEYWRRLVLVAKPKDNQTFTVYQVSPDST
jgi:hypothetical protein